MRKDYLILFLKQNFMMNIKDNRYYFGVYANMASHNIYMILEDIAMKTRLPKISEDGDEMNIEDKQRTMDTIDNVVRENYEESFFYRLKDKNTGKLVLISGEPVIKCNVPVLKILNGNEKKMEQVRIIELLHEHFPFLEALNKALDAAN